MGLLKGCIIIVVIVMVATSLMPVNHRFFKNSFTFKYIQPVAITLKKVSREDINAKYNEKMDKRGVEDQ